MGENINFIPATDLPVAEGEEVSVLCLENGAMKQRPASGLGGSEQTDMVIALNAPFDYADATADTITITIESGSLEAVTAALAEGRSPVVKCKRFFMTNGFDTSYPIVEGGVYDCNVLYYNGTIFFSFDVALFTARIVMDINDPEVLEFWVYPLMHTTIQVI